MKRRAIESHVSSYPNPVRFKTNEILELGRKDEEYPGWIWVKAPDGVEGWAPIEYLIIGEGANRGRAKFDYCAHELDVKIGELLSVEDTLNGWHYVTNSRSESGWVPDSCVSLT